MGRDDVLVSGILNGDIDCFSELVATYEGRIYNFLLKMTLSREDAEELLQEVFIKVYNNIYRYDRRWKFSTWIYRIAVNTFKNELRKRKSSCPVDYYNEIPEILCSMQECPEAVYDSKEVYLELVRLIQNLKTEQKIAFILKHIQGFSFKEIGEIMGISAEAVKMKVQRARETLGKRFEEIRKGGV